MLDRVLEPIKNCIQEILNYGTVTRVDDSEGFQRLQIRVLGDEVLNGVPRIQNYGFSSHPKQGSASVLASKNGERDTSFVIAVEDENSRIKNLKAGEVVVYTDSDNYIKMLADGTIEIKTKKVKIAATSDVEVDSPSMTIKGELTVEDNINCDENVKAKKDLVFNSQGLTGDSLRQFKTTYNTHVHASNGVPPTQQF